MAFFIYLLIAAVSLVYLWIRSTYSYWRRRGFVQADASFPFGSFKGIGTKVTTYEALNTCYKDFKGKAPIIGIYSFLTPGVMPLDPELIKCILVKDFGSFHSRGMYHNSEVDPLSASTLTLDGQAWKDRRVKLTPMFTATKMKLMFEIIETIGERFVNALSAKLSESPEQEMRDWLQRFTTDNIGNVAFGLECNCLEDSTSEFLKYGRRLFDLTPLEVVRFIFTMDHPKMSKRLGFRFNPKECTDFFLDTFTQTFEYRAKNNVRRNDFVSMLLELKDQFTTSELAAESLLVFAAGYETSSSAMTFTLYELALNQSIQERLREEIKDGIDENDGKLTYDTLSGFKYLDMVVQETLRKYPPIADGARKANKEFKVPGTDLVIPEGTVVQIPTYSLQHDPEYFPDPETFDPERFSEANVGKIKQFTFLPFGEGPRICLGMRFGLMQTKMGIAKMMANFKFSPCDKTTIPMTFKSSAPFITPINGMWLKVEKV